MPTFHSSYRFYHSFFSVDSGKPLVHRDFLGCPIFAIVFQHVDQLLQLRWMLFGKSVRNSLLVNAILNPVN
jgi:hypothetical protein